MTLHEAPFQAPPSSPPKFSYGEDVKGCRGDRLPSLFSLDPLPIQEKSLNLDNEIEAFLKSLSPSPLLQHSFFNSNQQQQQQQQQQVEQHQQVDNRNNTP